MTFTLARVPLGMWPGHSVAQVTGSADKDDTAAELTLPGLGDHEGRLYEFVSGKELRD